jgi:hypothetical protein
MKKVYYFTMEELIKTLYRATMKEAKHGNHPAVVACEIGGGITFNILEELGITAEEAEPILDGIREEILARLEEEDD